MVPPVKIETEARRAGTFVDPIATVNAAYLFAKLFRVAINIEYVILQLESQAQVFAKF